MASVQEAKVVFLGSSGVGKTSLVRSFVTSTFSPNQETTIGASFLSKILRLDVAGVPRIVKFNVWDTAGQEKYESLAQMYYRGCDAAVVAFDVGDRTSYVKAKQWVQTLAENTQGQAVEPVLVICGKKRDLLEQPKSGYVERCVSREEVEEYAGTVGGVYFETSAMEARDVENVFVKIAESLKVPEVESEDETLNLKGARKGDEGGCC